MLDDRTKLTAKKITEFLKESGDRFQKTIVFCVDEEHAARMRQALVNENRDLCDENHRYVMRITGSDKDGQDQLGNFIDPRIRSGSSPSGTAAPPPSCCRMSLTLCPGPANHGGTGFFITITTQKETEK